MIQKLNSGNKTNLTSCVKDGSSNREPGWVIQFAYDQDLIERLKKSIPPQYREWRADTKTWFIHELYEDELDRLFSNWYALAKLQGTLF